MRQDALGAPKLELGQFIVDHSLIEQVRNPSSTALGTDTNQHNTLFTVETLDPNCYPNLT